MTIAHQVSTSDVNYREQAAMQPKAETEVKVSIEENDVRPTEIELTLKPLPEGAPRDGMTPSGGKVVVL